MTLRKKPSRILAIIKTSSFEGTNMQTLIGFVRRRALALMTVWGACWVPQAALAEKIEFNLNALSDVSCAADQHPTGCLDPFIACDEGPMPSSPLANCREVSKWNFCPNFSWEKCCFVSCKQLSRNNKKNNYTTCMEQCNRSVASRVFIPKVIPGLDKSEAKR